MLQIIISPAKKMNILPEYDCSLTVPALLRQTEALYDILREMNLAKLKSLWKCSDKLAVQNYERLQTLRPDRNLTPAILAYEGIQYQYIAPGVFTDSQWEYVSRHLRILSGLYGVLRPTDGIIPYRLEMQAKLQTDSTKDLYAYWSSSLADEITGALRSDPATPPQLVNLASAEYSRAVLPWLPGDITCITCIFGELSDGQVKVKATQAKMARGEMVRWMAEHQIRHAEDIRAFDGLGYQFCKKRSSEQDYVFLKSASPR